MYILVIGRFEFFRGPHEQSSVACARDEVFSVRAEIDARDLVRVSFERGREKSMLKDRIFTLHRFRQWFLLFGLGLLLLLLR